MTHSTIPRVEVATLTRVRELGDGGQGHVYLVEAADQPTQMAYKEYRPEVRATVDWNALDGLVRLRGRLPDDDRGWLDSHAAWPTAVVVNQGAPCGFLMPVAPDPFLVQLRTSDAYDTRLFAFELLLNPVEYLRRVDLRVSQAATVLLLRELARVLHRLHGLQIAFGDLSPKNVAVSADVEPRCFLLDCDAVRQGGASVLPQVETPEWQVPEGEELATPASDIYKLALFSIRVLGRDQSTRDTSVVRAEFPDLAALADQSLSTNPTERPSAQTWAEALDAAAATASTAIPESTPLSALPPPQRVRVTAAVPGPTAGPLPVQPKRRRGWRIGLGLAGAAAALVCAGMLVNNSSDSRSDNGSTYTAPPAAGNTVRTTAAPRPTAHGIVDFSTVTDNRALGVAQMLDTYFSGINAGDFDKAISVYDPAGVIDPNNPDHRRSFAAGVGTSQDSDVELIGLTSGSEGVAVIATVRFTSRQAPGMGPARDPNETCTRWEVQYSLTSPAAGQYRILKGSSTSQPC